jgi:signal transduction histidine kinase
MIIMTNEFENAFWPIQPHFLSIREGAKKYDTKNDAKYSPNEDGLFYVDELRGFLADASDSLGIDNILAMFQVVPSDFIYDGIHENRKEIEEYHNPNDEFIKQVLNGRKIIRIYPGKLFSNISCCDRFREGFDENGECNNNKCFELDSRIALLYHDNLSKIDYRREPKKFYETTKKNVEDYNLEQEKYPLYIQQYEYKNENKNGIRLYIKYQCKYSQLEEYFFPIFHSGKVIAVLMQGQRFPKGLKKEEMFKEYRSHNNDLNESIQNIDDKNFSTSIEPMNDDRLKAITRRIVILEDRIQNTINAMAQKYVSMKFLEIEKDFRKKIKTLEIDKQNVFEEYKKILSETLKIIFTTFNAPSSKGFIRIYTIKTIIASDYSDTDVFNLIGDSKYDDGISDTYSSLTFNKIPDKESTIEKEQLLKLIKKTPSNFDRERDIFRMDVPFTSKMVYIIWKRYDSYSDQYDIYADLLKLMYHTLLEPYIILTGVKSEEKLEASMRISSHESVQVIPSILKAINNRESLATLEDGKTYYGDEYITIPMFKIIDTSFRLQLLEGLFSRSSLLFKDKQPEYKYFDFHRIIYAIESLYQTKANLDSKQKIILKYNTELNKYYLNTDYSYLSHVLFNLMDNAIKYGLRGSNIYVEADLQYIEVLERTFGKKKIDKIIISIISYGDEIIESERSHIFDLFYRSSKYLYSIEGMGIGLFLVKKLCNLLGYTVECKPSVKMADYHLPIKYFYTKQHPKFDQDISLNSTILQNLKKETQFKCIDEVVNQPENSNWETLNEELEAMVFQKTYRNEFIITIPIKDNTLKEM